MPKAVFKRSGNRSERTFTKDEWLNSKCSNVYCKTPGEPVIIGADPYNSEIHDHPTLVYTLVFHVFDVTRSVT
jgi:hypothetical protein